MSARLPVPLEKDIQAACLDYLNGLWGVMAWRANTGAMTAEHNGKKRFMRFGQLGQSDITGVVTFTTGTVVSGIRLEIEVKRPGKRPSLEQAEWLAIMARYGCIAFWCDSPESCSEKLKMEYMRRGWTWQESWSL